MTGYKQPPAHTRFKKGKSGNPNGRPKKAVASPRGTDSANDLAFKEAQRLITVREGEKTWEMPTIEAVLRAQSKAAISGNAFAQRDIVNRFEKAGAQWRSEIAGQCEFWEDYCDKIRKVVASAEARGEPTPTFYPHPDDLTIGREKGVTCRGPMDEEEGAAVNRVLRIRDLFLLQGELDRRFWSESEGNVSGSADVIALLFDGVLPKRLQISGNQIIGRMMSYRCLTKRVLLKELYQGWRSMGMPVRRGLIFRPARVLLQAVDEVAKSRGRAPLASGT